MYLPSHNAKSVLLITNFNVLPARKRKRTRKPPRSQISRIANSRAKVSKCQKIKKHSGDYSPPVPEGVDRKMVVENFFHVTNLKSHKGVWGQTPVCTSKQNLSIMKGRSEYGCRNFQNFRRRGRCLHIGNTFVILTLT